VTPVPAGMQINVPNPPVKPSSCRNVYVVSVGEIAREGPGPRRRSGEHSASAHVSGSGVSRRGVEGEGRGG